ncbi:MAG: hypothetical protein WDW36_000096 [Sanguina aurantia]
MVLSTRPDWTRGTTGIPIDAIVRLHPGVAGVRQDITASRNRVSVLRPGALQPKPEDEYDVSYCYGPESSNADLVARSLAPLIHKMVEGYNVAVIVTGATGGSRDGGGEAARVDAWPAGFSRTSRRTRDPGSLTHTLGLLSVQHPGIGVAKPAQARPARWRAAGGWRAQTAAAAAVAAEGGEGDGLVHLAIDELFRQLGDKAVGVGNAVAQKRRMPSAKGFDSFVETSYVELYNECAHDMYRVGPAVQANLPVYEDEAEGFQVAGLTLRMAKNSEEMRASFNRGRASRDAAMTDIGSAHERCAALFTIHLAQYAPAAVAGEEDRVIVSKLMFVDSPGAERLAMDPEVLRLREGVQLNRGLLTTHSALRALATQGSAQFVDYEGSLMTRLLADALGGNCLTLLVGCVRPSQWQQSITTLKQLALGQQSHNYPIINHGRARGLIQKLRHRLVAVAEERSVLREQLDESPPEGDPNAIAVSIAKVRDLEARLLSEREEKATLLEEKQALAARLMKLRDAGSGDAREKADVQEALIRSEEQRLALAKALIDFQMEYNDAKAEWEDGRFELESRILELEAANMERYVRAEDHAAVAEERDALNSEVLRLEDEVSRKVAALDDSQAEVTALRAELRQLHTDMNASLSAKPGGERPQPEPQAHRSKREDLGDPEEGDWVPSGREAAAAAAAAADGKRAALQQQLKLRERKLAEAAAESGEARGELARVRAERMLEVTGVEEAREGYRRRLETLMRDVGDMSRAVAIMEVDGSTPLRVTPEALFNTFLRLTDEAVKVTDEREGDMRADLDGLSSRHVALKRKFKSLFLAYRMLRYTLSDSWPPGAGDPPRVASEEEVVGGALEGILRSDDEAERRQAARLRDKASHLEGTLMGLRVVEAASGLGVYMKPTNSSAFVRENGVKGAPADIPPPLILENQRLREELDRLASTPPPSALDPGSGSTAVQAGSDALRREAESLRVQVRELTHGSRLCAMCVFAMRDSRGEYGPPRRCCVQDPQQRSSEDVLTHGTIAPSPPPVVTGRNGSSGGGGGSSGGGSSGGGAAHAALQQQVLDFTSGTQMELERKLVSFESRCASAEEQLGALQRYLATASVSYQREIVRLRAVVGQLDPTGEALGWNPTQGRR